MWQNTLRYKNARFMFPVFKFGKKEHTQNLLEKGQVHLSTLHEFRDPNKYRVDGTVHDEQEGFFQVINRYSRYFGKAKNAPGIIKELAPPEEDLQVINCTCQKDYKSNDYLIYCTAEHFFSETLNWALENEKDSCAMIVDLEMFTDYVSSYVHPDYVFVNLRSCSYEGRVINEIDPNEHSETEKFLKYPFDRLLFSKPNEIKYKEQYEVRAVWQRSQSDQKLLESEARTVNIPILQGFAFPVEFSSITKEAIDKQKKGVGAFGARIVRSDKIDNFCIFDFPRDLLSPVCYLTKEGWILALRNVGTDRTFSGGYIRAAESQIIAEGGIGPLFLVTKLHEVQAIQFFYDEDYQNKLKQIRSEQKGQAKPSKEL